MARSAPLYPPSPRNIPEDLTRPSGNYRAYVFVVLVGLLYFFLIYLGLLLGSAYLAYRSLASLGTGGSAVLPKVGLACFAGLLFLFLLKGFCKRRKAGKSLDIEITPDEHPRLFAFLERICEETGAPLPRRVYVNPEVNAAACYRTSVLDLFWPSRKDLLIGLGLVNVLNLTEFKAVLAHEFGHFVQNSLLGRYVYVARGIVGDMVYGRDFLDDLLDVWRSLDLRVSWPAWGFWGLLWVLRKGLAGLFQLVWLLNQALSREMEYHADLVAVSLTGSDAVIHVLARAAFAEETLTQALQDLDVAAHHDLYTTDLFHHQNHAARYLRRLRKDLRLGEPPPLPADPRRTTEVFQPGDDGIPSMWADHPPNSEREANAKADYLRTVFDERSSWLLFDEPAVLRERVTWRYYRLARRVPRETLVSEAQEVQRFLDEEHAATTYDPRYHGFYDNRPLRLEGVAALARQVQEAPWPAAQLAALHADLYGPAVAAWVPAHERRCHEYQGLLDRSRGGRPRRRHEELEFRGQVYDAADARPLLKAVERELDADAQWLADYDRTVFQVYYQLAQRSGGGAARELLGRYDFHLAFQKIVGELNDAQATVLAVIEFLSGKQRLESTPFHDVMDVLRKAYWTLERNLLAADRLELPALENLEPGQPLRSFLLSRPLVRALRPTEQSISARWLRRFLVQLTEVLDRARRIHFKSLGKILSLQEAISRARPEPRSVPAPASVLAPAPAKARPPQGRIKVIVPPARLASRAKGAV